MIANNNNPLCVKLQVMRNPVRADESSHQAHNTLYNAGCDTPPLPPLLAPPPSGKIPSF